MCEMVIGAFVELASAIWFRFSLLLSSLSNLFDSLFQLTYVYFLGLVL